MHDSYEGEGHSDMPSTSAPLNFSKSPLPIVATASGKKKLNKSLSTPGIDHSNGVVVDRHSDGNEKLLISPLPVVTLSERRMTGRDQNRPHLDRLKSEDFQSRDLMNPMDLAAFFLGTTVYPGNYQIFFVFFPDLNFV